MCAHVYTHIESESSFQPLDLGKMWPTEFCQANWNGMKDTPSLPQSFCQITVLPTDRPPRPVYIHCH